MAVVLVFSSMILVPYILYTDSTHISSKREYYMTNVHSPCNDAYALHHDVAYTILMGVVHVIELLK